MIEKCFALTRCFIIFVSFAFEHNRFAINLSVLVEIFLFVGVSVLFDFYLFFSQAKSLEENAENDTARRV